MQGLASSLYCTLRGAQTPRTKSTLPWKRRNQGAVRWSGPQQILLADCRGCFHLKNTGSQFVVERLIDFWINLLLLLICDYLHNNILRYILLRYTFCHTRIPLFSGSFSATGKRRQHHQNHQQEEPDVYCVSWDDEHVPCGNSKSIK